MNRKAIYEDLIQFDYFSDSYLQFEKDFNRYYKGVDPLTFLIDDILLTMAMKQKNYFRLHKSKSTDGRDHYFIFKVRTTNENKRIRIYEYQEMKFSIETKRMGVGKNSTGQKHTKISSEEISDGRKYSLLFLYVKVEVSC